MQPSRQTNPNLLVKAGCLGLSEVLEITKDEHITASLRYLFQGWVIFKVKTFFFITTWNFLCCKLSPIAVQKPGGIPLQRWCTAVSHSTHSQQESPSPFFSWRYALQPVVPSICEYRRNFLCWTWKHMINSFLTDFKMSGCHLVNWNPKLQEANLGKNAKKCS